MREKRTTRRERSARTSSSPRTSSSVSSTGSSTSTSSPNSANGEPPDRLRTILRVIITLIAAAALIAGALSLRDTLAGASSARDDSGRQLYSGALQSIGDYREVAPGAAGAEAANAHANTPAAYAGGAGDASSDEATSAAISVEVPDLTGKTVAEARPLLEALGLAAIVLPGLAEDTAVEAQEPAPDTIVPPATAVTLARADDLPRRTLITDRTLRVLIALDNDRANGGSAAANATANAQALNGALASARRAPAGTVVVIDPGHQARGDSTHEPVGPGATETKPRVTGGTSGVVTRIPEYEIALQISTNLKRRLEAAGATVIMTRTTNDVNISNAERAAMANEANAALFVRIHADGSTNPDIAGISTLYPGENRWTGPIAAPSKRAATLVHEATVASTGATSRGTVARTDLTGFNWATVPSVLVECGFMSNPVEDRLLSSPHYQDKLAEGMARGILEYLDTAR